MIVQTLVKNGEYHDSVALMLVARELVAFPGVSDASVVMATEANKALLEQAGLLTREALEAGPNDLVLAVKAEQESAAGDALAEAQRLLTRKVAAVKSGGKKRPLSLRSALRADPDINFAVISVAGRYAAAQTWDALHAGRHVLLFSDHVSLEDEIAFKQYAREHGLLMMGPGAGTAIINGVGLGFANAVPKGSVGIVSAAGTGLQEVSTLLAKAGVGITQGIGTGGRDVSEEVGGIMMLEGLKALQDDLETRVILIVSKLPSPAVTGKLLAAVARSDKPSVLALIGAERREGLPDKTYQVSTLREAAAYASALAQGEMVGAARRRLEDEDLDIEARSRALCAVLGPDQRFIRGLFSGGTLCEEAMFIWTRDLGGIWSNAPLDPAFTLSDSTKSCQHSAIDLGEEEFTLGRPHPMIDNALRISRLRKEAEDPEVAVIVLDVVLGYGVHPDPAAELGTAITEVLATAKSRGREPVIVTSVTGTDEDPQGLSRQKYALEKAGAIVMESNGAAASLAGAIIRKTME